VGLDGDPFDSSFHQDFPISGGMRTGLIFAVSVLVMHTGQSVFARVPKSVNEQSLLYWRYLCENQPQLEKSATHRDSPVELKCLPQKWVVKAIGDQVQEVSENVQ
jgi:hypothetical protein